MSTAAADAPPAAPRPARRHDKHVGRWIGAALTVIYAMATGAEPITFYRVLFIAGIVGAVIGLKLVKPKPARPE